MSEASSLERIAGAFEQVWHRGEIPNIKDFLPDTGTSSSGIYDSVLNELICLDLEYRWRRRSSEVPAWQVDDYLREFPQLEPVNCFPFSLIAEEFRVRRRFGDRPKLESYRARYPEFWPQLEVVLNEVAAEIVAEGHPVTVAVRQTSQITTLDAPVPYHDFIVQRMIGAGRMGKVYLAWQRSLEREVAIKFLRKSFLSDTDAIERFVREARIVGQLRHPNILSVYALGRTPSGGFFMVLDYVRGPDLARLAAQRPIGVNEALDWIAAAADALAHSHSRDIVHCDLKPANLLLDEDGRLLVADFGLARSWTAGTQPHEIAGTAPFMAPEQIEPGFGVIGPATDVYALGAVLYTLLAGCSPYQGQTVADILAQVIAAPQPPKLEDLCPKLPKDVNEICLRCLQKNPRDRYLNMTELGKSLRAARS